jgi:hypothetical protein
MLSPSQASSVQGSPAPNSNISMACDDEKKPSVNATLNLLKTTFNAIIKMERTFSRLKTSVLSFPSVDGGENKIVDRNDMKLVKKEFMDSIKLALKPNARAKTANDPQRMSGQYTPVILGPALRQFFANANFGNAPDGTPLLSKYPTLQQGFALQKVVYDLLNQYVDLHQLKTDEGHFIRSDDVMNNAFNNKAFPTIWSKEKVVGKQVLNKTGVTTYDILSQFIVVQVKEKQMNRTFTPEKFNPMINFRRLVPLNTYNVKHLDNPEISAEVRTLLGSFKDSYSSGLIDEAVISHQMRTQMKSYKEDVRKANKPDKPVLTQEQKDAKKLKTQASRRDKRIKTDNKLICKNTAV